MTDTAVGAVGSSVCRWPLACLWCRRRKGRCDGASPTCSNCAPGGPSALRAGQTQPYREGIGAQDCSELFLFLDPVNHVLTSCSCIRT
ncbi:hypothetical protein BJX96DRAFT_147764 [Aspergillus floccosus]